MAQGPIKKPSSSTPKPKPQSAGITKKGSRSIAPKNAKLRKQAKMTKKLTSGLTAQTEKMLGEKAGHLEMVGKGRDKTRGAGGAVVGKAKSSGSGSGSGKGKKR